MRRALVPCSLLAVCACATAGGGAVSDRTFERPEAHTIRLRTLDVALVAAGPPRIAEERFAVRGFDPPAADAAILVGEEQISTREALVDAVGGHLRKAGFEMTIHTGGDAASIADTSSTAPPPSSSSGAARPARAILAAGGTLASLLAGSEADGVLVIRVVPVDEFHVDVGGGSRIEHTALGRERVKDVRMVTRAGRLLVGQVFLFDRKTGARLWTKQAPDYPDGGRLTPDDPFLSYGHLLEEGELRPPEPELSSLAATRFVRAIFDGFPEAKDGDPAARSAVEALDLEIEERRQSFLDDDHIGLELGLGWGLERVLVGAELAGRSLPSLDTGAVAPNGVIRIRPRVDLISAGGLVASAVVPIGWGTSGFHRFYHQDNPAPSAAEDRDQSAAVDISGVVSYGLELHLGSIIHLGRAIGVVPRAGIFGEAWSIRATPATVVDGGTRARLGGAFGADVLLLPAEGSGVFGSIGADGRLGFDLEASFFSGFAVLAGVGVLL